MRATRNEYGDTVLILTSDDTRAWASRPGAAWPCSTLSGRRVMARFDDCGDLVDLLIDGDYQREDDDVDGHEFTAMSSDFLREQYGPDHPAIRGA
jgi:hypothetical protein